MEDHQVETTVELTDEERKLAWRQHLQEKAARDRARVFAHTNPRTVRSIVNSMRELFADGHTWVKGTAHKTTTVIDPSTGAVITNKDDTPVYIHQFCLVGALEFISETPRFITTVWGVGDDPDRRETDISAVRTLALNCANTEAPRLSSTWGNIPEFNDAERTTFHDVVNVLNCVEECTYSPEADAAITRRQEAAADDVDNVG